MTRLRLLGIVLVALLLAAGAAQAKPKGCLTIQSGELVDVMGNPIETGYDEWGYNYQAHAFNGDYCDYRRGLPVPGCPSDDVLKMNKATPMPIKLRQRYTCPGSTGWHSKTRKPPGKQQ